MSSRRDFLVQTAGIALGSAAIGCPGPTPPNGPTPAGPALAPCPGTFNLEVTVTGLCLFLPRGDKGKMHVLMVAPVIDPSEGAEATEPHYPRVFYDAALDSQVNPDQFWRAVPLESSILDLSGFPGQGVPASIPEIPEIPYLVDVRDYAPAPLPDPEAIPNPIPNLACRLTLPRGWVTTPSPSEPWELQGPPGQNKSLGFAAWYVVWTVPCVPGSELSWKLDSLRPNYPVEPLAPLHPDKDGMIRLLVSNAVRKESTHRLLPAPRPNRGTPMPHFRAFRDVYPGRPPWPKLVYTGSPADGPGATPYTCLPSGGK
jgi:hypothetical protein